MGPALAWGPNAARQGHSQLKVTEVGIDAPSRSSVDDAQALTDVVCAEDDREVELLSVHGAGSAVYTVMRTSSPARKHIAIQSEGPTSG
jgi:hypothetical protein